MTKVNWTNGKRMFFLMCFTRGTVVPTVAPEKIAAATNTSYTYIIDTEFSLPGNRYSESAVSILVYRSNVTNGRKCYRTHCSVSLFSKPNIHDYHIKYYIIKDIIDMFYQIFCVHNILTDFNCLLYIYTKFCILLALENDLGEVETS